MEDPGAQGGLGPQLGVCLPTQPRPGSTWPVNPSHDDAAETLTQEEGGVQPATVRQSGRGCGTWAGWVLVPQTSRGQRATAKVKRLGCQDTPTLGPLPPPSSPSSWLSDSLSLPAGPLGLFLDGSLSLGLSLSGPLSVLGPSVPSRPMPAACPSPSQTAWRDSRLLLFRAEWPPQVPSQLWPNMVGEEPQARGTRAAGRGLLLAPLNTNSPALHR